MEWKLQMTGLTEVQAMVGDSPRQARFAMALAMTRSAAGAWADLGGQLDSVIDRPTPYTRRALKYSRATPQQLVAAVGYGIEAITDIRGNIVGYRDVGTSETPAGKYLAPLVAGGARNVKRFERALQATGAMPSGWQAVPGKGARLDAYGNISRGQIIQILSQLGTELTAGYNRTMSKDPRKRIAAQRRAGGRFFAVLPGQGKLQPGVYQREFFGRNVTPVLVYVRATSYRIRYPFGDMAQRSLLGRLQRELPRAIADTLRTARR